MTIFVWINKVRFPSINPSPNNMIVRSPNNDSLTKTMYNSTMAHQHIWTAKYNNLLCTTQWHNGTMVIGTSIHYNSIMAHLPLARQYNTV